MATKTKTQVPVTPTPATPAKNALPTPKPFTESLPAVETDTESATVQMSAMSATPPDEQGTGSGDRAQFSPLGYQFSQISVAPTRANPALLQSQTEDEDRPNFRKDGTFETSQSVEKRIQLKRGKGQPLPDRTRSFMEDRFGNDFSQVRVHTDSTAVQLSQDLKAKAFTHGHDIYFNSGQYNPSSTGGKRLLAHELTHTIQQKGAKLKPKKVETELTKPHKISAKLEKSNPKTPEVKPKPVVKNVQRKEEKSGIDVNLKPLGGSLQPKEESSGIDVNLKPLAGNVQPKEESSGIDVNLKPLAAQIQRTNSDGGKIQTELIVGAVGDRYEQEADRMADQVMDHSTTLQREQEPETEPLPETEPSADLNLKPLDHTIQRGNGRRPQSRRRPKAIPYAAILGGQEESEDEQNVNITLKREDDAEDAPALPQLPDIKTDEQNVNITLKRQDDVGANGRSPLQLPLQPDINTDEQNVNITLKPEPLHDAPASLQADSDGSFQASSAVEGKIKSKEGGGSSLPKETQGFMESRFNNDFSGVRVHTDSDAVQMNKDLGAKAFTHKKDIYFNSGQYNPSSTGGKHLLAHELTHTIQQTGPSVKTQPDIQKEGDDDKGDKESDKDETKDEDQKDETKDENEDKKSISEVDENTTEISDDDYDEDDIEKLEKDTEKKEKEIEKDKKKGKDKGKEDAKETEDGDGQEGDVTPQEGDDSGEVDVTEDLKKQAPPPPPDDTAAPVPVPDVAPGQVESDDPNQNPAFLAVTQQIEQQGKEFSKHDDPKQEAVEVQDAVVDDNQADRKAKERKGDTAASQDPATFDREAFVQNLFAALGIEEPKSMKEVESGDGVGQEAEATIDKEVGSATTEAGGGMPEAAQAPPEMKDEDTKPVKEMEGVEGKIDDMQEVVPEVDQAAPPATSTENVEDKLTEQQEGLKETFGDFGQAKLMVGGPQDRYEVEADRMADTVMEMPDPQSVQTSGVGAGSPISRLEDEKLDKPAPTEPSPLVKRQILRAKTIAETIHRSPQWIVQREKEVEPEQAEPVDLGTGTGKTLTTKDMETFSDPAFGGDKALQGLQETEKFSEQGPEDFRKEEEGAIADTKTRNQEKSQQTTQAMKDQRVQTMTDMTTKKEETKGANEAARLKITEELNAIYTESQAKVDGILGEMDAEVQRRMALGKKVARLAFEIVQKAAFKKWQKNYYYHRHGIKIDLWFTSFKIFNVFLWAKEKLFTGLPDEVNNIYSDAREVYVNFLRQSIAGDAGFKPKVETSEVKDVLGQVTGLYEQLGQNAIAPYVEQKMLEAKAAIDEGKAKFQAAVDKLGPEEKQLAEGAISNIQGQFDNLENNVKSYQDNLVNDITESYKQGLKEIDDRIEALKAANQGLVQKALAFIGDVIKAILKALLIPIQWILSKFGVDSAVLDAIIDDPGGFMENFFTGLKDGFLNFAQNFPKHFLNGLVEWLFGNIGPIKLPAKFDLAGFFDIFMQVMGFTKDAIFAIASEVFGSDIVGVIESAIEGANIDEIIDGMEKKAAVIVELFYTLITKGVAAAWNFLGDVIDEMKTLFIKELTIMVSIEVVKSAIIWLIGILNPAAGIVKIIKAIVDVIIWFAQNYEQIVELIKTIFAGLSMIAKGDTAGFSKSIELVLAGLIPVALGFLATLIGLGGIANKIRKILDKITGPFRKGLKKMFEKVAAPFKKAFGKAKAWGAKKYNSAKEKAKAAKNKAKEKFAPKKKKEEKKTEKQKQKDEYKRKVKQQKTEVKDMISEGEREGEKVITNKRDPKEVKQGAKNIKTSVEKGKEFAEVKDIKVKSGFGGKYSNKYTLTGTIKKLKIPKNSSKKTASRQPMSGNSRIPQEALQTEAQPLVQLRTAPLKKLQRKKDKWKDKKKKLIVDDKSTSSKFVLKAKLIDEGDVLYNLAKDIEKKARKIKDKKPVAYFKPLLAKYKKQYDLTSIGIDDKTGLMDKFDREIEYEITAKVPPQEDKKASRKEASGRLAAPVSHAIEHRIGRSQGKGESLSHTVREPMEQAFGVDFSGVRIHRKTEGDTLSRSLNAKAFTTGQDIYFRSNTYRPDTSSGSHLIAHELTHVVQQSGHKPQVQRSPFFPQNLVQRQGDGPPSKPLFSHLSSDLVIQRDEDSGMDLSQTAVVAGAVAVGTAAKVMESSSSLKTDVDVYKDISKKKGTMEVFVRVQKPKFKSPSQQMADIADDSEGIPEFTRTLIAKHIETILRQDPRREVVEKKLPEVALKFDLDLVKIAGYTEIGGSSFEYKVLAQGNPKAVAQKKIEAMLKKMAKMGSAQGQPSAPQQDGTTELPPKPPEPETTKDKSKPTPSEDESGKTPDTENQDKPTPSTLESQKAKTAKVKAAGTPDGADTASAKPLSTKTQIKPGGDPKTLFVIARVDPEDKK
ncbi:eCIS core domain-containing protein [Roseofilum capinflatum]|uniref:DUF4157 domain-containing protein n=1 Tax=Roseofilum capinflatum BLCC-M114 TaxID=3022440 RepID=A0ABT7B7W1_9CYAN|nr:DUF4157 domain-containing protein [Roseofilum capinflatum]MDJ1175254.1 DUF4157 domain-containing protein [Roseofilum capinflatum BLCC-M114]